VILILVPAGVGVTDYEHAKHIMIFLLGPATVGLAVPRFATSLAVSLHPTESA
jgi:putative effector of murein hydrolase